MRAMLVAGMGALFLTSACKPRVIIVTGTTLGLKATPGDGNSRPPQVTLGYKRAEAALVPTSGAAADDHGRDAFATMAAFDFRTRWFGATELASFVGTGFAARDIQGDPKDPNSKQFERAFAAVTLGEVSQPLQDRRKALVERARGLSDATDRRILAKVGRPLHGSQPASDALAEAILDADTEESVKALEDAFGAAGH